MKTRDCYEIGTLQAFLDGETGQELSTRISDHVLECDACAAALAEAEEETALVFSALDRELNTLVPTQRLWTRINESIETEKSRRPFWERAYAFLATTLANPSLVAAAGILLFVGVFAFIWTAGPDDASNVLVAGNTPQQQVRQAVSQPTAAPAAIAPAPQVQRNSISAPIQARQNESASRHPMAMTAGYRPSADRNARPGVRADVAVPATLQYIPGEESYVRTIAELSDQVEGQKDRVLPGASRVAFERDLAVVNDAIRRTRESIRRNPSNPAAKQMLYAAYQDKVDLLNSVGQREELMASLR